jgi:protein-L-isoaspartate(D-aspartate) O-methyltransferase
MDEAPDLQTRFALNITLLSGLTDQRIFQAFAAVKREEFLGPPPWYRWTSPDPDETGDVRDEEVSSSDPAFVYEDDVVAIDRARGINNGAPGLHARCLAALGIQEGQDILHIGAGTEYYSAILAELTGADGHVSAFEIDPVLAGRAKENLAPWPQVEVQASSGISSALPAADIIYVNAGATHPCKTWIDALRPGGKLLFPFAVCGGLQRHFACQKTRLRRQLGKPVYTA